MYICFYYLYVSENQHLTTNLLRYGFSFQLYVLIKLCLKSDWVCAQEGGWLKMLKVSRIVVKQFLKLSKGTHHTNLIPQADLIRRSYRQKTVIQWNSQKPY